MSLNICNYGSFKYEQNTVIFSMFWYLAFSLDENISVYGHFEVFSFFTLLRMLGVVQRLLFPLSYKEMFINMTRRRNDNFQNG